MKIIAPCKDCPDRVADPNCHGYCEKYLLYEWLKEESKKNEVQNRELDVMHYRLGVRRAKMGGMDIKKKAENQKRRREK